MALTASPASGAPLAGKRLLITGGTGFIGNALVERLARLGANVTVLTRNALRARTRMRVPVRWIEDLALLNAEDFFDFLINLAGESLADGRWTSAKKQRLLDSRLNTTQALLEWVRRTRTKPAYLLSGSAVGYYGPMDARPLTEASPAGVSFGARLCVAWEKAADEFGSEGVAVCKLRLGVVFARRGGAFAQLRRPFDFKVATVMGDGQQYCSWIHRDDLLRAIEFLLSRPAGEWVTGAVNATAPQALTYAALADGLAHARSAWLRMSLPAPVLRALLGEMADELLLSGQNVVPSRLLELGFQFRYPSFAEALPNLLGTDPVHRA